MHSSADDEGNIWFALFNGTIAKLDEEKDSIVVCSNDKKLSPIDGLCCDKKNNLWIGAASGLYCYNEKEKLQPIKAFNACHVLSVRNLNDSMLIGGTMGKGFFLFNTNTKAAQFFNASNNLSSNIIFGGIAGNNDDIWIVAENAIERMNLKTKKIYNYDINYGIKDHVFERAVYKLKNGTVLVASNSGILYFNINSIAYETAPPDVAVTSLQVNQNKISVDSILQLKEFELQHDQNELTIEYASVSFIGRNTDKYFYKLNGVDKNWIDAGTRRSVTYANLSPGHYIFNVKCVNKDDIQTKRITALTILIHAPWWKTWWAYILWILIFGFILFLIYDYRKRSALALSAMRQKIANDLHDDIGSTLNSISVYSAVASHQIESNTENAKDILEKMGTASRNMIDNMNDIVWAVNPKNDQFENILLRMQYFAGELLSGKNILLDFNADERVRNIKLPMQKRKNFYLIFKEAITNAYKYSNAAVVNVDILLNGKQLTMIIRDNGNGFAFPLKTNGGNGLKNMHTRADEMNAVLNIISSVDEGTKIELKFLE